MEIMKEESQLWATIEEAARKKFKLDKDCVLTMVDFGHPIGRIPGKCYVDLNKLTDSNYVCQGYVVYDPNIYPANKIES